MNLARTTTATLTALATALLVGAAPAHADSMATGSLTARNTVAYPGCRDNPINWSVNVPAGAQDFDFSISVTDPTGEEVGSDFIWQSPSDSTSGVSDAADVCDFAVRGTYMVTATDAEWMDADYNEYPFTIPATTFTVRSPHSRTTTAHRQTAKHVTVKATVKDERKTGYFATKYAAVKLQVRRGGKWRTLQRGLTNGYGHETFSLRRHRAHLHKVTLRLYTPRDGYSASTSKPFRVRR
jgi:hypothetical protein